MITNFMSSEGGLKSGGTISGDVTINGDLTVNGDGSGNYDEIVNGNIEISDTLRLNPTISSGSATTLAFMRSGTNKWRFIQPSDDSYLKLYNDQATATQMYFKSDNSIGIGTDNPACELHISSAGTTQLRLEGADASSDARIEFYQSTTAKGFAGFNDSTDTMAMVYDTTMDSTKGININSSGNVGIGASPLATQTGYTLLQLGGTGTFLSHTATGTDNGLILAQNVQRDTDSSWEYIVADEATIYEQSAGVHWFYTATAGSSGGDNITFTTNMKIDNNSRISLSNNDGGTDNTVFGFMAGNALASGSFENTLVGDYAGTAVSTGDYNTAIGKNALLNEAVGQSATAVGYSALANQESGSQVNSMNVGVGINAGAYNETGTHGTFIGANAAIGVNNNNHQYNTAVGANALFAVTTGSYNAVLGQGAGKAVTDGHNNVAIGNQALMTSTSAGICVVIGDDAMKNGNASQDGTVAIGGSALYELISGIGSTAIGWESGKNVTSGDYNTGYGYNTLGGNSSTALTGDRNTAIGASAGRDMEGASTGNTLVGDSSGIALTTGNYNTAVGYQAGDSITDGNSNVLVGRGTGVAMTSQDEMVLIGNDAGAAINNDAADGSIGIGYGALAAMTSGTHSTVIGASAGAALRGSLNTIIGHTAATALYTGTSNTVIGARAMGAADGGEQNNVIIGTDAGDVINDDAADGNVIIGHDADPSGSAGTNQIVIGQGATGVGNNSVTLGNASILNVYAGSDGGAHVHCSGVSFPATQDPSGGANVLDDYEEGDWTPVLSDGSNNATMSSSAAGRYTKIGPLVYLSAYVITTGLGSVSGAIRITGLPFTARNDGDANNGGSVGYAGGLEVAVNENVAIRVAPNTNYIQLSTWDVTGGTSAMQQDEWTANGEITMSLTYHAA